MTVDSSSSQPAAGMNTVPRGNIRAIRQREAEREGRPSLQVRLAGCFTRFTGSMTFVFVDKTAFGFWIVANLGWILGVPQ